MSGVAMTRMPSGARCASRAIIRVAFASSAAAAMTTKALMQRLRESPKKPRDSAQTAVRIQQRQRRARSSAKLRVHELPRRKRELSQTFDSSAPRQRRKIRHEKVAVSPAAIEKRARRLIGVELLARQPPLRIIGRGAEPRRLQLECSPADSNDATICRQFPEGSQLIACERAPQQMHVAEPDQPVAVVMIRHAMNARMQQRIDGAQAERARA